MKKKQMKLTLKDDDTKEVSLSLITYHYSEKYPVNMSGLNLKKSEIKKLRDYFTKSLNLWASQKRSEGKKRGLR